MPRKLPPLTALPAFDAAARHLSFTKAAEELNLTHGAISRAIRNIEDRLGIKLFERGTRSVRLTPEGAAYAAEIGAALDRIGAATIAATAARTSGILTVSTSDGFAGRWLMPRLQSLRAAAPELEITLTTRLKDDLVESGALDCAIRFGNGEWDGLDNELLMNERHIAVCSPALLAECDTTGIDLNAFTLLHVLAASDQRYLTWQHWLKAANIDNVDTRGGYEFDLLDNAIRAATDGLGVTIADRHMIGHELRQGTLVPIVDVEVDGHQSYWLVTRTGQDDAPQVALFREWLRGEIGKQTQALGGKRSAFV